MLAHYVDQGVGELNDEKLPDLVELKYGGMRDAQRVLGSMKDIREVFVGFQAGLYTTTNPSD